MKSETCRHREGDRHDYRYVDWRNAHIAGAWSEAVRRVGDGVQANAVFHDVMNERLKTPNMKREVSRG